MRLCPVRQVNYKQNKRKKDLTVFSSPNPPQNKLFKHLELEVLEDIGIHFRDHLNISDSNIRLEKEKMREKERKKMIKKSLVFA